MRLKRIGLILAAIASFFLLKSTPLATALIDEALAPETDSVSNDVPVDTVFNATDSIGKARLFQP